MVNHFFSDREQGMRPRVNDEVPQTAWAGIVAEINSRIADASFGLRFPKDCPDSNGVVCGCDEQAMGMALRAVIPDVDWPLDPRECPSTAVIMDVIEFCYHNIAKPSSYEWHSFFRHDHLNFDVEEGKELFLYVINRIFQRNGLAYELGNDGYIRRFGDDIVKSAFSLPTFRTGDQILDDLLVAARTKFLCADPRIRREALEKLWDAWERIKTIEQGNDKKESISLILNKAAAEPNLRQRIDTEARELTDIGNNFHIRHAEVTQTPIQQDEQVDYLFLRMYALILLLLRMSGRAK